MSEIPWTPAPDDFDDMWFSFDEEMQEAPDMLATMHAQQIEHMRTYSEINPEAWVEPHLWGDLRNPKVQAALHENFGYVIREFGEAMGHLKNKPWKQTQMPVSEQGFREELADVWHFWLQFLIIAGLNPLDMFADYFQKALINLERQRSGY